MARLAGELGYPCAEEVMATRVRRVIGRRGQRLFVAENGAGAVCGWLQASGSDAIESGFRVEIVGLVVESAARRAGVGRRLVAAAEQWAAKIGAETVCARSNIQRRASHLFYRQLGYETVKTQKVYRKRL